jgi:DnaJ-class molecular chaperone
LNPGDKAAEEKFKEVAGAYDLLSDADNRKRFDNGEIDATGAERPQHQFYRDFGSSDEQHPYDDSSGYADFMESEDAFAELLRRNAKARANRRGPDLHFRLPIAFSESITGASKRLTLPDGGTLDVTIPPGLVDRQILRLRGRGAAGTGGHGDALIEVEVMPDPRFTREGDNISLELPIRARMTFAARDARMQGSTSVNSPYGGGR